MNKKMLTARIDDLFGLCEKRGEAQFSSFLDGGEIAVIEDEFHISHSGRAMLFGGYDDAERCVLGIFPEWEEPDMGAFPISVILFDVPKFRALSHRDYLGAMMSLGIERNKTGDILTDDAGAFVIAESGIAEYAAANVTKIANAGVRGHIISAESFNPPAPKLEERTCIAASLRLDAVIASVYNISRSAGERLVKEGLVKVNHREAVSRSAQLNAGDLVSVRGRGRFLLHEVGGSTGKGRLHITVMKYI